MLRIIIVLICFLTFFNINTGSYFALADDTDCSDCSCNGACECTGCTCNNEECTCDECNCDNCNCDCGD